MINDRSRMIEFDEELDVRGPNYESLLKKANFKGGMFPTRRRNVKLLR